MKPVATMVPFGNLEVANGVLTITVRCDAFGERLRGGLYGAWGDGGKRMPELPACEGTGDRPSAECALAPSATGRPPSPTPRRSRPLPGRGSATPRGVVARR